MPEQPGLDLVSTYDGRHADAEAAPGLIIPTPHIVSTEWVTDAEDLVADFPDFQRYDGPAVGPILELHYRHGRAHDGWVTFHRKPATPRIVQGKKKDLDNLFSIRAADLRQVFPQVMDLLDADAYFSINAFKFPRSRRDKSGAWVHKRSKYSPDGLDLPEPNRKKVLAQWITACYTDLDCYKIGVSTARAVGAVLAAQDAGIIPPPSMWVRSGQGVWVFWFLVGDKSDEDLVPAFPEKRDLWYQVQNRIHEVLASVGADAGSKDISRITRVPGSINRKSGVRTEYALLFNEDGTRRLYRLGTIADWLGVRELHRLDKQPGRAASEVNRKKGESGWRARWRNYYADFHRLWSMRGGRFKVGMRNKAVCLLVTILRTISKFEQVSDADVAAEVRSLFDSLEQSAAEPYTEDEMLTAIRETKPAVSKVGGTPGRKRIANLLEITPEEAAEMTSWTIPAARFRDLDAAAEDAVTKPLTQKEKAARRRVALKDLLDGYQKAGLVMPSLPELAELLNGQGHECAFRTVKDDLVAIEAVNPRRHRRRRRRKSDDPDRDRPLLPPKSE